MTVDLTNYMLHIQPFFKFLFDDPKEGYNKVLLSGGRVTGKTTAIVQKLIWDSMLMPYNILVMRATQRAHKDSTYAAIKKQVGIMGLEDCFKFSKSPLEITNKATGCRFIFRGSVGESVDNLKGLEQIGRTWIEEAALGFSQDDIDEIELTMRDTPGVQKQIYISFNKKNPYTCPFKDYIDDPETYKVVCNHSTYIDNDFCDKDTKLKMDILKENNYKKYLTAGLGHYGSFEDLVLNPEKITEITLKQFNSIRQQDFYKGLGIDWGKAHPMTFSVSYYDEKNNDLYIRLSKGQSNLSVRQFEEIHMDKYDMFKTFKNQFADSADSQGGIIELNSHGWNIKSGYKNGMEECFIDFWDNLNNCYVITDESKGFLEDVRSWSYKNGVPEKVGEDYIDSVRYSLEPIIKKLMNGDQKMKTFSSPLFNQY